MNDNLVDLVTVEGPLPPIMNQPAKHTYRLMFGEHSELCTIANAGTRSDKQEAIEDEKRRFVERLRESGRIQS